MPRRLARRCPRHPDPTRRWGCCRAACCQNGGRHQTRNEHQTRNGFRVWPRALLVARELQELLADIRVAHCLAETPATALLHASIVERKIPHVLMQVFAPAGETGRLQAYDL